MPITKDSRFRWVRPVAKHLNPEIQVWQPMLYREYPAYLGNGRMIREYVNFYEVGIDPEECELGDWIEYDPPLPKFGVLGKCNRQQGRAESDLCPLPANHKGPCISE